MSTGTGILKFETKYQVDHECVYRLKLDGCKMQSKELWLQWM